VVMVRILGGLVDRSRSRSEVARAIEHRRHHTLGGKGLNSSLLILLFSRFLFFQPRRIFLRLKPQTGIPLFGGGETSDRLLRLAL
jgi:hypothetical protein